MPESLWWTYDWMHLIGRVLFAALFVMNGAFHVLKAGDMAGYAESKGVPAARGLVVLTGLMILAGGLMVALGWHRFIGAGLIVIFLIPTSFMMHDFWKQTDPTVRMSEMQHFMKNMALAGAALFVAYYGGGPWPMSLGG